MNRDRWTVLLLRDGDPSVRRYRIGPVAFRLVAGALGFALLAAGALVVLVGVEGSARHRADVLARENRALSGTLDEMRDRVDRLESRVGSLSDENARVRALAGLEPIPDEVLDVGVGGPGTPAPDSRPLPATDAEASDATFALEYDVRALERRARLLSESLGEATDSLMAHRDLLESTPSILPTAGYVSSSFSRSRYHPIHHRPLPHEGVDLAAERGTPILAAAKGRVVQADWESGYGQMVEIDHGYGFRTRYGHASELLVREGQRVERGDVIAQVGSTGLATAPNLHYEVLVDGRPRNPMNYVLSGAVP